MKKTFSKMTLLISIVLTTIIPMIFTCYQQTQIIEGDTLQFGFPFIYYNITAIIIEGSNIKYAVLFQLGAFIADIVVVYFLITIIAEIVKKIKKSFSKKEKFNI